MIVGYNGNVFLHATLIIAGLVTSQSLGVEPFIGKWTEPHGDTIEVFSDGTFQLVDNEHHLDPSGVRRLKLNRKTTGDLRVISRDRLRLTGPSQVLLATFQLKNGTLYLDIDGWGKRFFARPGKPVLFGPTLTVELLSTSRGTAGELQAGDAILKRRIEACIGPTYVLRRNGQRFTVSFPDGFDINLIQMLLTTRGDYTIARAKDVASERNAHRRYRLLVNESSPWLQQYDLLDRVRDQITLGSERASIINGWPVVTNAQPKAVAYDSSASVFDIRLSVEVAKTAKRTFDQYVNLDQPFALCLDGAPVAFLVSSHVSWNAARLQIQHKLSDQRAFFINMLQKAGASSPGATITRQETSFWEPK